jgi:hypothetical protein
MFDNKHFRSVSVETYDVKWINTILKQCRKRLFSFVGHWTLFNVRSVSGEMQRVVQTPACQLPGLFRVMRFVFVIHRFWPSTSTLTFRQSDSGSRSNCWNLWFKVYKYTCVGRESVVSIATGFGLGGSGIEFRWGRDFLHPSKPGPTQPPIQWVPGPFYFIFFKDWFIALRCTNVYTNFTLKLFQIPVYMRLLT